MSGVLTAGSGQQWEADFVARLEQPGSALTVVRRCADVAEVVASAAAGQARVAVLDGGLRRFDSDAVQRLRASGVTVVGVHAAGDERTRERLERLGVTALVSDDAGAATVLRTATEALAGSVDRPGHPTGPADPRRSLPPGPPSGAGTGAEPDPAAEPGRVVAVWGPTGAPGRTTVAAGLADALASSGVSTLLIDADAYGGVLASAFGVLDESPGTAGACRLAATGRLEPADLDRLCWSVGPSLRLLTGIGRADRWPELRPSALPAVLTTAARTATVTVVDCGFAIEADEELSFDTMAPRRNGATLAVLSAADVVLAVGSADPPGMERLVRGLLELAEVLPEVQPAVVLNRVRPSAASGPEALQALRRFTGIDDAHLLPRGSGRDGRGVGPCGAVVGGGPQVGTGGGPAVARRVVRGLPDALRRCRPRLIRHPRWPPGRSAARHPTAIRSRP